MNRDRTAWALVGAVAVLALVALPVLVESVRLLYVVACCLLLPGSGWAYRAKAADTADGITLTLAISMSATILVATAMVVTGTWSVPGGVIALLAITVLGYVPYPRAERG